MVGKIDNLLSNRAANIGVSKGGSLNIDNSAVSNSKGFGIAVQESAEAKIGNNTNYSDNASENVFHQ